VQGATHEMVAAFVKRHRRQAATADTLLCSFASTLADVPVDVLRTEVPDCVDVPAAEGVGSPPAQPAARKLLDTPQADIAHTEQSARVAAAQEWLSRLQGWLTQPGVPLLQVDVTEGSAADAGFLRVQLSRQASPYLVRIFTTNGRCCCMHVLVAYSQRQSGAADTNFIIVSPGPVC
jgi:hypothetical protein